MRKAADSHVQPFCWSPFSTASLNVDATNLKPFTAYSLRNALNKFTQSTIVRSAHTVFMWFVFIWEQTATCATYSINWLVFITEVKSVYCAVRTGSLNKAVCASYLKVNLLKPTGHVVHQQFNIQQLYVLPTLYLCVLCLSESKQRLVPHSINWSVFITEMKVFTARYERGL